MTTMLTTTTVWTTTMTNSPMITVTSTVTTMVCLPCLQPDGGDFKTARTTVR